MYNAQSQVADRVSSQFLKLIWPWISCKNNGIIYVDLFHALDRFSKMQYE